MVVVVGIDVHKGTHCAVAVDEAGRQLERPVTVRATDALHRIAVTQTRLDGLGQLYYQRRRSQGNTTMEALRALKRRLARVIFHLLRPTDTAARTCVPAAA